MHPFHFHVTTMERQPRWLHDPIVLAADERQARAMAIQVVRERFDVATSVALVAWRHLPSNARVA